MLLTLVITLLLIWAAVIGTLYSNFLTFYSNFAETENYNKAYYASIAALERAELVVRQREPWYVWSWWWVSYINDAWDIVRTSTGGFNGSDWLLTWFSYLSSGNVQWTNVLWNVNSRATRIPSTWWWNVDWLLATWDNALDYNKMDYENAEIFLLYYDNSTNNPYTWASCAKWFCTKSNIDSISWKIKLPQKLYDLDDMFWPLDTWNAIIWKIANDAVVDWQLRWTQSNVPFTVYATQSLLDDYHIWGWDTTIREDDVNRKVSWNYTWVSILIWNNKSPIVWKTWYLLTVISPNESSLSGRNLKNFFTDGNTSQLQLRLALLNILNTKNNTIYPYLEYYLDFWWKEISDKYFTMDAEWKYWDYQVNLIIQKPTAKESILWSFTTIFE